MRGFLQRVQRQDLQRGLGRPLRSIGLKVRAEEPGQPLERALVEPLPLDDPPFLERCLVDAEAVQQVALVEDRRALEAAGLVSPSHDPGERRGAAAPMLSR
jgi:hypothetical protein